MPKTKFTETEDFLYQRTIALEKALKKAEAEIKDLKEERDYLRLLALKMM